MDGKPSTSSYSQPAAQQRNEAEDEPLRAMRDLSPIHCLYQENREHKDRYWKYAYLGLLALSALWGVAAIIMSDKRFDQYSTDFFMSSTSCDVRTFEDKNPLYAVQVDHTWVNAFRISVTIWLPISVAAGLVFSVAYVLLFRRFARAMVIVSVATALLLAYLFAILTLAAGSVPGGVILLVVAVLLTGFYWWIRGDLATVAKLLSVAGTGLLDNPWLIPTSIGIKLGGIGIIGYLAFAFISAIYVGSAGPAGGAYNVYPGVNGENGYCTDEMDNLTACCVWNTSAWTPWYCLVSMVTMLWTSQVIMQIKLYVCADVMACWYFQPQGPTTEAQQPSIRRAMRNCLGPAFGSVAFAAAILAVVRAVRSTLQRASRSNVLCCIINCFAQPLLALLERFTQFATIATAITGRSFLEASTQVFQTLMRCELPIWSLWWLPDMVLGTTVLLFTLTWSAIVYFSVSEQWDNKSDSDRTGIAFAVAATCFACVGFQARFISGMLLDVVNTIYICYAFDRDIKCVTRPEIHVIYQAVPTVVGPVVENPDGMLSYGAPIAQQQQQQNYHGRQSYNMPPQQYNVPVDYVYPGQQPTLGIPAPGQAVPSYQMATSYGRPPVFQQAQQPPQQQQQGYTTYSSAV